MRLPSLWRGEPLLTRWLRDDFDKLFEEFFGRARPPLKAEAEIAFLPVIDLVEREGELVIKAELPGVTLEDVEVAMVGDTLQIRGEKKVETEERKENTYFAERSYGTFLRTIPLPVPVDAEKITARLEKGILEVVVPKSEMAKPMKIEVKGEAAEAPKAAPAAAKPVEAPRPREERARETR